MRAAPAVEVAVSPPAAVRVGTAALAALAAAAGAAWLAGHAGQAPVMGLLALVPGAALGYGLGPRRAAWLAWDGEHWHCDGERGRLSVQLDLQSLMLLRWAPAAGGRPRWLLPHRAGTGPHWHALRVALFAGRPGPLTDPAGQPPLTP
jgi:hypothetical protein